MDIEIIMKRLTKSTSNLLATLNSGGKVSSRVHQETLENAKLNGWIEWTAETGWTITNKGYLAYIRA